MSFGPSVESAPDDGCLFPDIEVTVAADVRLSVELGGSLLEVPDEHHHPVVVEKLLLVLNRCCHTLRTCSCTVWTLTACDGNVRGT
jgi:hypothetical protein